MSLAQDRRDRASARLAPQVAAGSQNGQGDRVPKFFFFFFFFFLSLLLPDVADTHASGTASTDRSSPYRLMQYSIWVVSLFSTQISDWQCPSLAGRRRCQVATPSPCSRTTRTSRSARTSAPMLPEARPRRRHRRRVCLATTRTSRGMTASLHPRRCWRRRHRCARRRPWRAFRRRRRATTATLATARTSQQSRRVPAMPRSSRASCRRSTPRRA